MKLVVTGARRGWRPGPLVAAAVLLAAASCSSDSAAPPFPAGSTRAESIRLQYAVYYLPVPAADPAAALHAAVEQGHPELEIVEELAEPPVTRSVSARLVDDVGQSYRPPDPEYLRLFGRGLRPEQVAALQESEQAFVLDFGHPAAQVWEALAAANRLVEQLARESGGLVWDEETRELFTPDAWRKRRIDAWTSTPPDLSAHTVIHAYREESGLVRAITLGMSKFGLPDLVVEELPWSLNDDMGALVNRVAQAMAEGAEVGESGYFELEMPDPPVREGADLEGVARLVLRAGERDEGDPANRLAEIAFDRYPGRDVQARQVAMLTALFGADDSAVQVDHDAALLAASERARALLPALKEEFEGGLAPGEFLLVKAPFEVPGGGNEWMWVEVIRWEGERITGVLQNDPVHIPRLQAGDAVKVNQGEVFDYIRTRPDGRQEGNETGRIIEEMSASESR